MSTPSGVAFWSSVPPTSSGTKLLVFNFVLRVRVLCSARFRVYLSSRYLPIQNTDCVFWNTKPAFCVGKAQCSRIGGSIVEIHNRFPQNGFKRAQTVINGVRRASESVFGTYLARRIPRKFSTTGKASASSSPHWNSTSATTLKVETVFLLIFISVHFLNLKVVGSTAGFSGRGTSPASRLADATFSLFCYEVTK